MNKNNGTLSDFAPLRTEGTQIVIGYGLKKIGDSDLYEWYEVGIDKTKVNQLNLQVVKDAIIADINERIKENIISGFVWNDKPVWLSEENQMNFAQAVVPATFKIGEQADGTPIYQEFTTKTELKNFVEACVAWKQHCLTDGWAEKDGIDLQPYQALFPSDNNKES